MSGVILRKCVTYVAVRVIPPITQALHHALAITDMYFSLKTRQQPKKSPNGINSGGNHDPHRPSETRHQQGRSRKEPRSPRQGRKTSRKPWHRAMESATYSPTDERAFRVCGGKYLMDMLIIGIAASGLLIYNLWKALLEKTNAPN